MKQFYLLRKQGPRALDRSEFTQMKIPYFGTYLKKVQVTRLKSTTTTNKTVDMYQIGQTPPLWKVILLF